MRNSDPQEASASVAHRSHDDMKREPLYYLAAFLIKMMRASAIETRRYKALSMTRGLPPDSYEAEFHRAARDGGPALICAACHVISDNYPARNGLMTKCIMSKCHYLALFLHDSQR